MSLEVEFTAKEWFRLEYLVKKNKEKTKEDETIMWKCHIFGEQCKIDDEAYEKDTKE